MNVSIKNPTFKLVGSIVLTAILTTLITNYLGKKPPRPNVKIKHHFLKTLPFSKDYKGGLHLNYDSKRNLSGLRLFINNTGEEPANNFEINIICVKNTVFMKDLQLIFEPSILENRVVESFSDDHRFYKKLNQLPPGAKIIISLKTNQNIGESDIRLEFLSNEQYWRSEEDTITLDSIKESRRFPFGPRVAYGSEKRSQDTDVSEENKKSGIYIGGYNPISLSNNLLSLLQKKNVITSIEAKNIVATSSTSNSGILIGGVNLVKFNEIVLNILIKKNVISYSEANEAVSKSKNSGGVLFGGINVIVLEVEILNLLLKKDLISRAEGQQAIDKAR
jgi:hypothetical protein